MDKNADLEPVFDVPKNCQSSNIKTTGELLERWLPGIQQKKDTVSLKHLQFPDNLFQIETHFYAFLLISIYMQIKTHYEPSRSTVRKSVCPYSFAVSHQFIKWALNKSHKFLIIPVSDEQSLS